MPYITPCTVFFLWLVVFSCFHRNSGWIAFFTMATVTPVSIGQEQPSLYWWCWDSSVAMAANQRAGRWTVLFWNICDTVHVPSAKMLQAFVHPFFIYLLELLFTFVFFHLYVLFRLTFVFVFFSTLPFHTSSLSVIRLSVYPWVVCDMHEKLQSSMIIVAYDCCVFVCVCHRQQHDASWSPPGLVRYFIQIRFRRLAQPYSSMWALAFFGVNLVRFTCCCVWLWLLVHKNSQILSFQFPADLLYCLFVDLGSAVPFHKICNSASYSITLKTQIAGIFPQRWQKCLILSNKKNKLRRFLCSSLSLASFAHLLVHLIPLFSWKIISMFNMNRSEKWWLISSYTNTSCCCVAVCQGHLHLPGLFFSLKHDLIKQVY